MDPPSASSAIRSLLFYNSLSSHRFFSNLDRVLNPVRVSMLFSCGQSVERHLPTHRCRSIKLLFATADYAGLAFFDYFVLDCHNNLFYWVIHVPRRALIIHQVKFGVCTPTTSPHPNPRAFIEPKPLLSPVCISAAGVVRAYSKR